MATHYFPEDRVHFTWDAGNEPVITIADGDTVVINTRDVSDNQIGPDSDASVIDGLNWDRVYPLAGPIAVEGAKPGDTLVVEILDLRTRGWGWTAILPGLGLLADDFPDAYLKIFDISAGDYARFGDEVAIPLTPFMGTMGVCPADASATPIMPPGRFGGNMDTRQLVAGTTLYLPVQVDGAMFSTGDAHGCQGDGEVCVTGLEAPMYATLRFSLDKKRELPSPQFRTAPGSLTSRVDHGGWYGTTGVGPDLFVNAQNAVRAMIDHITDDLVAVARGRLPAVLAVRRPEDLRGRRRGRVDRQRAAAGGGIHRRVSRIVAMGGASLRPEDYDPRLNASCSRWRGASGRGSASWRPRAATRPSTSRTSTARSRRTTTASRRTSALFERTVADLRAFVLAQDVVWVGGGNTASLLAVWRDARARCRAARGVGGGRGALRRERGDELLVRGLDDRLVRPDAAGGAARTGSGLLPGSCCPHYDGEEQRRPLYRRLVAEEGFPPGYAADDAAALVFEGVELAEVVSTVEGSTAYRVDADGESLWPRGCSDERRLGRVGFRPGGTNVVSTRCGRSR